MLVSSIFSENVLIFLNNFNYIAEFKSINPINPFKKVAISPYVFYFQNTAMATLGHCNILKLIQNITNKSKPYSCY